MVDKSLQSDPQGTRKYEIPSTHHEFKSHCPGRTAHHSGCSAMAFTPRCTMRYRISCRRGRASSTLRAVPSGKVAPVQKISADVAARGQVMGSRLFASDCSDHRRFWPDDEWVYLVWIAGRNHKSAYLRGPVVFRHRSDSRMDRRSMTLRMPTISI